MSLVINYEVTQAPRDYQAPIELGKDVSIATAAYGNAKTTAVCLEAILRSAKGPFELILVDDCSPDQGEIQALFESMRARHANTRVFSFPKNLEYTGSLNAVLSHATGQSVFFVSNDIFVTPSYLRALLGAAKSNPKLGILRGSSNFVDNELASHNIQLPEPFNALSKLNEFSGAQFDKRGFAWEPDPFLVGDAFMTTRSVIDRIGTFDPRFFGYFGDPDYGLRAVLAGFEVALVPGAFAYHLRDANFEYLPQQERDKKLQRRWSRVFENWARFKWKYELPVDLEYKSVTDIPWMELARKGFDSKRDYCAPGDYSRYAEAKGG